MGTKLLYAKSPIASSPNNICIIKLGDTSYKMDRILELKSSTESIKRTMLMQEHIFKQQVKELHRLYNLQRKLMLELKNEISKMEDPRISHKSMIINTPHNLSTWQQPRREIGFNTMNLYGLAADQQKERSGSCSAENSKILIPIRGLNTEMSADQEGSYDHEKSSKMRNIHRCDEDTDVELSLSIGPSNSKKRLKSHMHKEKEISFSTSAKFEREEEYGDGTSSATFNKESVIQTYWFFQDLNSNKR